MTKPSSRTRRPASARPRRHHPGAQLADDLLPDLRRRRPPSPRSSRIERQVADLGALVVAAEAVLLQEHRIRRRNRRDSRTRRRRRPALCTADHRRRRDHHQRTGGGEERLCFIPVIARLLGLLHSAFFTVADAAPLVRRSSSAIVDGFATGELVARNTPCAHTSRRAAFLVRLSRARRLSSPAAR